MSTEEIASPTKRPAEDEVPEVIEPKKVKPDVPASPPKAEEKEEAAPAEAEGEDDEDVGEELAHLDTSNIIEGRRTRGNKIDYTKVQQPEEDEDEDDEDAVENGDADSPAESDEDDDDEAEAEAEAEHEPEA